MHSWPTPYLPHVSLRNVPDLHLFDSATGEVKNVCTEKSAYLYVCGVTPYDAAHLGHAATYVTFDVIERYWRAAGVAVHYVQNVTDVDDPLLERAESRGIDWQELAQAELSNYRTDMTALSVIPPAHLVSVVDQVPAIADAVALLVGKGLVYPVANAGDLGPDYYADLAQDPDFTTLLDLSEEQANELFADRGGDPDRPGKRQPLDPLMWRAQRPGEPHWPHQVLGAGRPGWHVECSVIAERFGTLPVTIQGGGRDLAFPHHPMSASHARVARGGEPFAQHYVHTGLVGLAGEKMSKSRGNLVFVRQLLDQQVPAAAVRLALLSQHYRADWMWTDDVLKLAQERYEKWLAAFARPAGLPPAETIAEVLQLLSQDLQTPAALAAIDHWADQHESGESTRWVHGATGEMSRFVDAVLGVRF